MAIRLRSNVISQEPKAILAANLRRLRAEVGLSQEDLADRAGVHRTYISSVERGQRNVSLENIFGLAVALGVDARDLIAPLPADEGQR